MKTFVAVVNLCYYPSFFLKNRKNLSIGIIRHGGATGTN